MTLVGVPNSFPRRDHGSADVSALVLTIFPPWVDGLLESTIKKFFFWC